MARQKLEVQGAKEIEKVLDDLPDKMREKTVMNATRAGARVIRDEAKSRVPVRTGELRDAITVKTVKKSKRSGEDLVKVGFEKPTSRRAHLTEYGTVHSPAQPFMRPAIDSAAKRAIEKIGKSLASGAARNAKKLAGPMSRKQRAKLFK